MVSFAPLTISKNPIFRITRSIAYFQTEDTFIFRDISLTLRSMDARSISMYETCCCKRSISSRPHRIASAAPYLRPELALSFAATPDSQCTSERYVRVVTTFSTPLIQSTFNHLLRTITKSDFIPSTTRSIDLHSSGFFPTLKGNDKDPSILDVSWMSV